MIREFKFKVDWLLFFLILLPTFYVAGHELRSVQMSFFQLAVIVLIGLLHVNKFVGLFMIWAVFQFVFFKEVPIESIYVQNVFFATVLYQFVVVFSKREYMKKYMWLIYGVLIFNVLWIPLQIYNVDPIWAMRNQQHQTVMSEYPGFFSLPAFLGNYAAAALPLAFSLGWPLVVFAVIGLWFSKSTFSVLAAVAATLFYFWFKRRMIFWILAGLLAIGVVGYATKDVKTGQFFRRVQVWKVISHQAFKKQFFGHGLGSYGHPFLFAEATPSHKYEMVQGNIGLMNFAYREAKDNDNEELVHYVRNMVSSGVMDGVALSNEFQKHKMDIMVWGQAHNEYLQIFFEMGIVGVLLIMFYIIDLFKRFLRYGTKNPHCLVFMSCFVAIVVVSIGHFPFHLARLAGTFIVLMAFLEFSLLQLRRSEDLII